MASAKPPRKVLKIDMHGAGPHNGEGRPEYQFPDPVSGEMIGGQVAALRMALRYPHTVLAWARRQGKTKFRQFLFDNESMITSGDYYAGICYPDHTSAFKVCENFIQSWGPMVADFKNNDKDQDRWVRIHRKMPPPGDPPKWFTPRLKAKWLRVQKEPNTGVKVYFWGAQMPYARKIQGFPHGFHRIDWDECQEIDPAAYPIVAPMLRDLQGFECDSGTPWKTGPGNVWFERLFRTGRNPEVRGWFSYRIPDGSNPFVPRTDRKEALRSQTEEDLSQTLDAQFLSDAGSVFGNLDAVFILKPLPEQHASTGWVREFRSRFNMPSIQWWIVETGPRDGHVYGMSVDWARSPRGDWSVATVFDFTTGRQVFLARWRGENFPAQLEMVLAIQQHYRAGQAHCDSNGMGETMADFMRKRHATGFVGHRFGRNKADYVRRGQILFQEAAVSLIDCETQRYEFKDFSAFQPEGIGERTVTYSAPAGQHDDTVAAFLHLAPTLTIVGKQDAVMPEPEMPPVIDAQGNTSLALWAEGLRLPPSRQEGEEAGLDWDSVVLPKPR